jgi:S-(hydroxymethyl)glutathione dehydrogenase/alcohol dehydrogenase
MRDFPWLAQAYLNGSLKLDELISMRLPLKDINIGFDALAQGNIVRAVIQM